MITGALIATLVMMPNQCKLGHRYDAKTKLLTPRIVRNLVSRAKPNYRETQLKAMEVIAKKESTYKVNERDPRSTAYGLYGFLNSTWKDTGIPKSDCPTCQTIAALKYVEKRYGSPEKALAFHRRHGWY